MVNRFEMKVFYNVLEMMPNIWPTPLVRLSKLSRGGKEVFAKLEFMNPFSHSIKDRAVWYMLINAYKECIDCGKLYEASSGNTAIALACISNALGLAFRAYLPRRVARLTRTLLRILGAEIIDTDYDTINRELIKMVSEHARRDGAINLNQFENDNNFNVHYNYTAKEIDKQLKVVGRSPPSTIIAGIGTSGHIAGIARYFKERYGGDVKVYGVIPSERSSIPGIKRFDEWPKWLSPDIIDGVIEVSFEEAVSEILWIARNEGLLVGLSSGAVTAAYKRLASENKLHGSVHVLIYPDDIFKYLSDLEKYV